MMELKDMLNSKVVKAKNGLFHIRDQADLENSVGRLKKNNHKKAHEPIA